MGWIFFTPPIRSIANIAKSSSIIRQINWAMNHNPIRSHEILVGKRYPGIPIIDYKNTQETQSIKPRLQTQEGYSTNSFKLGWWFNWWSSGSSRRSHLFYHPFGGWTSPKATINRDVRIPFFWWKIIFFIPKKSPVLTVQLMKKPIIFRRPETKSHSTGLLKKWPSPARWLAVRLHQRQEMKEIEG